jgi:hypothetical protein
MDLLLFQVDLQLKKYSQIIFEHSLKKEQKFDQNDFFGENGQPSQSTAVGVTSGGGDLQNILDSTRLKTCPTQSPHLKAITL